MILNWKELGTICTVFNIDSKLLTFFYTPIHTFQIRWCLVILKDCRLLGSGQIWLFRLGSIKNIKQNIQENIVQCWFYETSIKILRLINKGPSPLLLICRKNVNADSVKPIL